MLRHCNASMQATRKNYVAIERMFSSALVNAEGRAQRENVRREERGSGRGTRRELWAPPGSGSSTSGSYVVSCTDARPSPPTHFLPSAASSPSPLPAGHREKFRRRIGSAFEFFVESLDGIGGAQHGPIRRIELKKRQQGIQVFLDDLHRRRKQPPHCWFFAKNFYITSGVLNRFSFSSAFTHSVPHYPRR